MLLSPHLIAWSCLSPISHKTLQCGVISLVNSSCQFPYFSQQTFNSLRLWQELFLQIQNLNTGNLIERYIYLEPCPPVIGSRRNVDSGPSPRNSSRQCDRSSRKTMLNSCACFPSRSNAICTYALTNVRDLIYLFGTYGMADLNK
jgi:hypothetical protein